MLRLWKLIREKSVRHNRTEYIHTTDCALRNIQRSTAEKFTIVRRVRSSAASFARHKGRTYCCLVTVGIFVPISRYLRLLFARHHTTGNVIMYACSRFIAPIAKSTVSKKRMRGKDSATISRWKFLRVLCNNLHYLHSVSYLFFFLSWYSWSLVLRPICGH